MREGVAALLCFQRIIDQVKHDLLQLTPMGPSTTGNSADFEVRMMIRHPPICVVDAPSQAISVGQRAARLSERSPRSRDGS
jgi:hypothetical protein